MSRYGRLLPGFGTMYSYQSNLADLGGSALEMVKFGKAADKLYSFYDAELAQSKVDEKACLDFYDKLDGPTALVWKPLNGVGHAAVFIEHTQDGIADMDRYASLFPGQDVKTGATGASPKYLLPGKKFHGKVHSFQEDCRYEGYQGHFRLPEIFIPMPKLDPKAMIAEWIAIRDKDNMHYRLMRKNCSTIAARVIRAGAPGSFSVMAKHHAWWTPYDVVTLAKAVA